jgi:lysophospholipase L1-like esterase
MSGKSAVVACLGSSSTAAKGSYDWIGDIRSRPENAATRFYNFGVGGDLAYNALERLDSVVRCRPDKVVVLIGGNDVLTRVSRTLRRFLGAWKRFPREPSSAWYEENLRRIVRETKSRTGARVAACSLVPIGEAPESPEPLQQEINRLLGEYRGIIERVAREEGVTYLPVYEGFAAQLRAAPGRAFTELKILSMYGDAFRLLVLRQSLDEIGERNGWRFHTDGIHLNSRGGKIVADVVQAFVAA